MDCEVGTKVWYDSPKDSWCPGEVTAKSNDKAGLLFTVKAEDGSETVDKLKENQVFKLRAESLTEDVNDLLMLTELHESTLLSCLRIRHKKDVVYTNIGAILVALNPFKYTIPWYMDDKMGEYLQEGPTIEKNLPHSWAVAHCTYYELINDKQNQCILVSGESGAGKTEAGKIVMKYLGEISCARASGSIKEEAKAVGFRIQQASPILEAFGNAKTVRNDNSSRFGKFMQIQFSAEGYLVGAFTIKYLLEKSRVITAANNERVYHSLYQITAGADAGKYGLAAQSTYKILNAGKTLTIDGVSDKDDYSIVKQAMTNVKMSDEEIDSIWRVVGGILNLENVEFAGGDASTIAPASTELVKKAATLWGISDATLAKELTTTTGKDFTKALNVTLAGVTRSSLSKAIYDCAFSWLVEKVNNTTNQGDKCVNWVGLLDIFGFENFEVNSFEQLCINLANEQLQFHYNNYIFTRDKEDCRAEGVDVSEVEFQDNQQCLDMVAAKGGIFECLDDVCATGSGTDKSFLEGVVKNCGKNMYFDKKPQDQTSFGIKHYAGSVKYEIVDFTEKNKDTLKDGIRVMMGLSTNELIAKLVEPPVERKGRAQTVAGFFKSQLQDLMSMINSTNPHWIRCIKPHPAKKAGMFSGITVMGQMRSAGVLETVRIRQAGYPIRVKHDAFVKKFKLILGIAGDTVPDYKASCKEILDKCEVESKMGQIGTTKVFMKQAAWSKINMIRDRMYIQFAETVQRFGRGHFGRLLAADKYVEANRAKIEEQKKKYAAFFAVMDQETKERGVITDEEQKAWDALLMAEREAKGNARINYEIAAAVKIQKVYRGYRTRASLMRNFTEEMRAAQEFLDDKPWSTERDAFWRRDELWNEREVEMRAQREEEQSAERYASMLAEMERLKKQRKDRMQVTQENAKLQQHRLSTDIESMRREWKRQETERKQDRERSAIIASQEEKISRLDKMNSFVEEKTNNLRRWKEELVEKKLQKEYAREIVWREEYDKHCQKTHSKDHSLMDSFNMMKHRRRWEAKELGEREQSVLNEKRYHIEQQAIADKSKNVSVKSEPKTSPWKPITVPSAHKTALSGSHYSSAIVNPRRAAVARETASVNDTL